MRTLVLGAYGHYGKMICQKLIETAGVTVIGAGKRRDRLSSLANELDIDTVEIDWRDSTLAKTLVDNKIHVVIHAAGPFIGQDYSVAEACIDAGCYYFDIADCRDFVTGIRCLDARAKQAQVVIASGMGLMTLNDSILSHLQESVSMITHVDIGFSGSGIIPGRASVETALSYCGKPIDQLEAGRKHQFTGLTGRNIHHFGKGFASRDMVNLDAPDLDVLTERYSLKAFRYQGGYGLWGQRVMSVLAKFSSAGWIKNPVFLAPNLMKLGKLVERFSSTKGGLYVEVEGRNNQNQVVEKVFELHACGHKSDEFKIVGAVAMINRLMANYVPESGAYPACGLVDLTHTLTALGTDDVNIYVK